jgi:hypothetical protein
VGTVGMVIKWTSSIMLMWMLVMGLAVIPIVSVCLQHVILLMAEMMADIGQGIIDTTP